MESPWGAEVQWYVPTATEPFGGSSRSAQSTITIIGAYGYTVNDALSQLEGTSGDNAAAREIMEFYQRSGYGNQLVEAACWSIDKDEPDYLAKPGLSGWAIQTSEAIWRQLCESRRPLDLPTSLGMADPQFTKEVLGKERGGLGLHACLGGEWQDVSVVCNFWDLYDVDVTDTVFDPQVGREVPHLVFQAGSLYRDDMLDLMWDLAIYGVDGAKDRNPPAAANQQPNLHLEEELPVPATVAGVSI